jgi:hypothetical protein
MANVLPTSLDTTMPGHSELTICDGFAFFKSLGTARARTSLDDTQGTFFDKSLNFELFEMKVSADHASFVGICGPAYAIKADTSVDTGYQVPAAGQPSSGTLVLDEHEIRGGFQFGVVFQLSVDLEVKLNLIFKKKTLVDVFAGVYINVLLLILNELLALLADGGGGGEEGNPNDLEKSTFTSDSDGDVTNEEGESSGEGENASPGKFDGAGMVDAIVNPFKPNTDATFSGPPQNSLEPNLAFGFDIVPLILEATGLEPLAAAAKALEDIGCGFEMGPGVTVGLPTEVKLTGATISNHPFDVTGGEPGSEGTDDDATVSLSLQEQTPISPNLQPLTDTADEIGLILEHQVGINVGLYFFADFVFFKVIHFGAQTGTIPLFFSQLPGGGPFENHLDFVPGGGPVPFAPPNVTPTVGPYTANQPQGRWQNGILAQYGFSYFNSSYESPIGPFSAFDSTQRFFAFPQISNIAGPVPEADGVRIYRRFNDGSPLERVGEVDFTTTTFVDNTP